MFTADIHDVVYRDDVADTFLEGFACCSHLGVMAMMFKLYDEDTMMSMNKVSALNEA
jgi:hypothetical protein